MKMFRLLCFAFLVAVCGCKNDKAEAQQPIVAPTAISTEQQGNNEPSLPEYTPWWIEE